MGGASGPRGSSDVAGAITMPVFPRRGEIFLALFPGEEKDRPAVVVSLNARNERANSVIAVPVTTNPRPLSTHVDLPAGEGGLEKDSVARCENLSMLPKSWMREL